MTPHLFGPWGLFRFLNPIQLAGLFGRGISPSQGRYLPTGQHKHRINAHKHPCLEWDSNPRPVFVRAKTVHALDRVATVVGIYKKKSGCVERRFVDLGFSWKWMVSFTPQPLYARESPQYSLYMRLVGPQSRSGRHREEKILYPTGTLTPAPLSSSP
jgi:hypothetical protein